MVTVHKSAESIPASVQIPLNKTYEPSNILLTLMLPSKFFSISVLLFSP